MKERIRARDGVYGAAARRSGDRSRTNRISRDWLHHRRRVSHVGARHKREGCRALRGTRLSQCIRKSPRHGCCEAATVDRSACERFNPFQRTTRAPRTRSSRGTSLGADVTMLRRLGGSYSGLRVLVGGEEPIRMAEQSARDFIAMLDSAARVTRELSVPPPTIMASMPIRDAALPAERPVSAMAPTPATAPAPTPVPATAPAPVSTIGPSTTGGSSRARAAGAER